MLVNGRWLIPTLNDQIYISKPPLFYWIAAFFGLIFHSTAEWIIRLPSALSALGVVWITFDRVKKYIGEWQALFAVILMLTAVKFSAHARRAEIEMLLTLWITLCLLYFFDYLKSPDKQRLLYLSYFFLGLAFLTKGPVALLFFLPPLLVFWSKVRDRNILSGLLSGRGWMIFAFVAFPWYIYCYFSLDDSLLASVIHTDIVGKTVGLEHKDGFYWYFLDLIGNFAPWILILFYRTGSIGKGLFSRYETAVFGWWALMPLLVFSCIAEKHSKYLLPIYPAVAVFLGAWLTRICSDLAGQNNRKLQKGILSVAVALLVGWAIFYDVVESSIYKYRFSAIMPMAERIKEIRGDAPVYFYQEDYPVIIYYLGNPIPIVGDTELKAMLDNGVPFLLIADNPKWGNLDGSRFCVLGEYTPFLHRSRSARVFGSESFCKQNEGSSSSASSYKGSGDFIESSKEK
jgi:4-amino-4-deoxy-L-arabinose transferase-like glycosyltransferase